MNAWYEEEDRVLGHPCDPYSRVDTRESSRHVRVALGGETVAATPIGSGWSKRQASQPLLSSRGRPGGPALAEQDPDRVRLQGGGVLPTASG